MSEQVAIMREVGIGTRDVGRPVLWFTTYVAEHSAALQVLDWEHAGNLLEASGVYDVKSLEGKPCWVEVDAGYIRFVRMWKP